MKRLKYRKVETLAQAWANRIENSKTLPAEYSEYLEEGVPFILDVSFTDWVYDRYKKKYNKEKN